MEGLGYLIGAYAAFCILVTAYIVTIHRRQKRLEQEIEKIARVRTSDR